MLGLSQFIPPPGAADLRSERCVQGPPDEIPLNTASSGRSAWRTRSLNRGSVGTRPYSLITLSHAMDRTAFLSPANAFRSVIGDHLREARVTVKLIYGDQSTSSRLGDQPSAGVCFTLGNPNGESREIDPSATPALYRRDRRREGAARRRCLEQPRSEAGRAGLYYRQRMKEPRRVRPWPRADRGFPHPQMGTRTRLSPDQRGVDIR